LIVKSDEDMKKKKLSEILKRTNIALCKKETELGNNKWDWLYREDHEEIAKKIIESMDKKGYKIVKSDKMHTKEDIIAAVDLFIKEKLPNANAAFHHEAEIAAGMERFQNWILEK
jgi:dTDP-D-glucose 4,6-dehydratase